MTIRCSWDDCKASTEWPFAEGWGDLADWPAPVKDGFYCPAHTDALEIMLEEGGFEDPENDLR
jgi:hypothetical protein